MADTKISIDRITLIAYDDGHFTYYLNNSGYVNITYPTKRTYGFKHAFKGQYGEFIEVDGKGKVRLDFNPNKVNMDELGHILSYLKYPHLTRLDIAVDYFGVDFQNINWSSMRARKRNHWADEFGTLETLYIGSPTSARRFRIYNKAMEMKEKEKESTIEGHWWRVEVQQRFTANDNYSPSEYLLPNLFDIKPYRKNLDISFIEKFSERMMVAGLLEHREELKKADKKTRAKYKKLLDEVDERAGAVLENPPHEVYEKEKSLLADQLKDLLSKCARLTAFEEVI
ncbi:replication initiation factor domain-containing protein [Lysinibacillus pakistanensis]|uniref:replication initiation factor domain-containing protein n=1 Tax=Lysinibacillus pakistanensis TaxID=759811 RepID=UPI003D265A98